MATQLKNIVSFVGIPAGGTVIVPHLLNLVGVPLVPDYIDPSVKGLTVTGDATNISVTNTTGAPISVDVLCESWHTLERVFGGKQTTSLVPQPFISGGEAAGAISAPTIVFIYRPGGVPGGNVYVTWPSLMTALDAVQGAKVIQFDDSVVSPCVIPAGGPYDMRNTAWAGTISGSTTLEPKIRVVEGATFSRLRQFMDPIEVEFTGSTPPVSDFLPFMGGRADSVLITRAAEFICTGTGPFFRNTQVGSITVVVFGLSARFLTGSTPVFDLGAAGTFTFFALEGAISELASSTISGVVGSIAILAAAGSALSTLSETQPGFLGILTPVNLTRTRWYPTDVIASDTALTDTNQVARVDPTGGVINITFPPAFNARGQTIIVKNVSVSANAINVLPSGGDTIDGAVSAAITAARGVLQFVSDGTSDWLLV